MITLTKTQRNALYEIRRRSGGVVMTSEWTTGHGHRTRRRAVPPFCQRVERWQAEKFPKRIKRMFKDHPRCQAVIAVTNMRATNKALSPK